MKLFLERKPLREDRAFYLDEFLNLSKLFDQIDKKASSFSASDIPSFLKEAVPFLKQYIQKHEDPCNKQREAFKEFKDDFKDV
mmetsp:Transcript_6263/g.9719  ORF Transcript_6263/g.9719 Transcript_6263/m.9719 type:complete len:83 (+) Transcript_6263:186-434(+)